MIEPTETGNLPTEERPANTEESLTPAPKPHGFAAMSPERRKQITSKGGKAAHAVGLANKFTKETAREAGKLGGAKTGADRARMAEIGRLGGLARGRKPTAPPDEPCDDGSVAPLDNTDDKERAMRSDLSDEHRQFATRLKARRLAAHMSRLSLAKATQLTEVTIWHVETGRTKPRLSTIVYLLQVPELKLTLDDVPTLLREQVRDVLGLPRVPVCEAAPSSDGLRPCSVGG